MTISRLSSAICCCSFRWSGNRNCSISSKNDCRDKPGPGNSQPLRRLSARLGFPFFHNLTLQLEYARCQLFIPGLEQECIEAATMIDRLERVGRHAQFDPAAERVLDQRDIAQVRQEPPLGLDV